MKSTDVNEEKFNGYMEVDKNTMALIKLFQSKKKIKDHRDIHALAEKLGMEDPAQLEEMAYALLQAFWANGRAMEKGMDFEVDEKEVKMGIKVEMEHSTSELMAYRVALDHLAEMKDYYTLLAEMEKKGGVNESEDETWYCDECKWSGPKSSLKQPGNKCPKCGAKPPVVHKK